ncbi:MAG: hypothetical protein IJE78_05225 [Bacteroidaceae bacterium]|nr:hypothetical protein [Bacteroidaceae bacterium]
MKWYNTLTPYEVVEHNGIQYGVCRDYNHICRYRRLRQVVSNPQSTEDRFIALETPNPFETHSEVIYYDVSTSEENRLDLIAFKVLGSAQYAWAIAYFNGIQDGFTAYPGQRLMIPKNITQLFEKGECLASVSPITLNLGTE